MVIAGLLAAFLSVFHPTPHYSRALPAVGPVAPITIDYSRALPA